MHRRLTVPRCGDCKQDNSDDELVVAWGRCGDCVRRARERALANYVLAMSEEVVEIPFGWCTARCAFGDQVDWLCCHIHPTRESAEACLEQTRAEGRGIFPIR